jgi:hypothetical protein
VLVLTTVAGLIMGVQAKPIEGTNEPAKMFVRVRRTIGFSSSIGAGLAAVRVLISLLQCSGDVAITFLIPDDYVGPVVILFGDARGDPAGYDNQGKATVLL